MFLPQAMWLTDGGGSLRSIIAVFSRFSGVQCSAAAGMLLCSLLLDFLLELEAGAIWLSVRFHFDTYLSAL
jgi:hypothetical protein